MIALMSFISGLVMAAGLILSGMIDTKKVMGFLDIFGSFDPSLAFVMMGALIVTFIGFRIVGKSRPLLCERADMPQKTQIDSPLVVGAAIFGIGWGLAGFCPAPAIVSIGLGIFPAVIFCGAMVVGMFIAKKLGP